MSCAALTPQQKRTEKNLNNLRALFDGIPIKDIDGKSRNIGKSIVNRYTDTSTSFGKKMFEEIVWEATNKPADASFTNFTDGDFRRIANSIEKEAKRLDNPKLGVLEKYAFVKRGVMSKYASTRWMNKHINLASNYERTKNSYFISSNIAIAKSLRAEILKRNPPQSLSGKAGAKLGWSSENATGVKLEKLERQLIIQEQNLKKLEGESYQIALKENQKIRDEIAELLVRDSGQIMTELVEFLHTTPNPNGKRYRKAQPEKRLPNNRTIPEVLEGQEFSRNIEKAGMDARSLLDNMGGVLINGLNQHKKALQLSFNNIPNKKLKRYLETVDEHIKHIEEGVKAGDYFPHYVTESLGSIEKIMNKIDTVESMESKSKFLGELEDSMSMIRQTIGSAPTSSLDRSKVEYDNYIKNPMTVLRKYSMDAIAFNRTNYLKRIYLEGMKHLPKEAESSKGLTDYLNDVFTLAERGYQDRPVWVNKTVRALTGFQFLSKLGFGVGTAMRNTASGMYFIQSAGNKAFFNYLRDWNKAGKEHSVVRDIIKDIEREQGFRFEDMSNPLFTEGLLPTEGVRVNDVDIVFDPQTKQPSLQYKTDVGWQSFDKGLTKATGAGGIFQKVTEIFLRKHMFRYSFKDKYNELVQGGLSAKAAKEKSKVYALDIVNKYAFEYSPSQKAPIIGGTGKDLGILGQLAFQFMHYPMSFLQLQSNLLRNSKDAVIARQWNSPDMFVPLKFAGLYFFTQLMSGLTNSDLNRIMEYDTVDRALELKRAVEGEDVKGRGYVGPLLGELFFYATLFHWIEMPDNALADLIVGYNDAYKLTDEQKQAKILSSFNVELAKQPRNWKALQNGTIWTVFMNETGTYPKKWTREMREKPPLNQLPWEKKNTKYKTAQAMEQAKLEQDIEYKRNEEFARLFRAMQA